MRILATLFAVLLASLANGQENKRIVILHTNDMHSRLTGFSPEASYTPATVNDDKTVGGFARIATVISEERKNSSQLTLALDGGDFLMGTLFHTVEEETGFQLPLMKKMGYDVVCLGNHEFDFGVEKLVKILRASQKTGELPVMLLGNAQTSAKDNSDNGLEELYREKVLLHTYIMETQGLRIGFFSLLGVDAVDVAPFSKPVTFLKQIPWAEEAVRELKGKGCGLIVCLSHSGLKKGKDGAWEGEDAELAEKVAGIDVIISAHTHSFLDKPLIINNIPIVSAGEYGEHIGKLILERNGGRYSFAGYSMINIDDKIEGDKAITSLINEQITKVNEMKLKPQGLDFTRPLASLSFDLNYLVGGDPSLGNLNPLVADAIYSYINNHSSRGTDLSMVSAGVIRDRMLPEIQTAPDIFRVMPLGSGKDNVPGYALSRLYVTGREIKNILEVLLVAGKSNTDYYCSYSGIRVEYNPDKGLLKKVKKIDLVKNDGSIINIDLSKSNKTLYSVSANSYMLEFMGVIKKKTFGLVNVVPKDSEGNRVTDMSTAVIDMDENKAGIQEGKEWLALTEYLSGMKDTNGDGIADVDKKYAQPVKVLIPVK